MKGILVAYLIFSILTDIIVAVAAITRDILQRSFFPNIIRGLILYQVRIFHQFLMQGITDKFNLLAILILISLAILDELLLRLPELRLHNTIELTRRRLLLLPSPIGCHLQVHLCSIGVNSATSRFQLL